MHCNGCASTIKGSITRQPGVLEAKVDYRKGEAAVLYDPSKTDSNKIKSDEILREPFPFEAEIIGDEEAGHER